MRDPSQFDGAIPLPDLSFREGLEHWQCNEEIFTCGEVDENERMDSLRRLPKILPTMYPPPPSKGVSFFVPSSGRGAMSECVCVTWQLRGWGSGIVSA